MSCVPLSLQFLMLLLSASGVPLIILNPIFWLFACRFFPHCIGICVCWYLALDNKGNYCQKQKAGLSVTCFSIRDKGTMCLMWGSDRCPLPPVASPSHRPHQFCGSQYCCLLWAHTTYVFRALNQLKEWGGGGGGSLKGGSSTAPNMCHIVRSHQASSPHLRPPNLSSVPVLSCPAVSLPHPSLSVPLSFIPKPFWLIHISPSVFLHHRQSILTLPLTLFSPSLSRSSPHKMYCMATRRRRSWAWPVW